MNSEDELPVPASDTQDESTQNASTHYAGAWNGSDAKVLVVTGAGSGIGRAVAQAGLAAGFRVVLAGRREPELASAAGSHPQALVVQTDVCDPDQVEALFAQTVERFRRVDVLFNNAGIFGPAGSVDEISLSDWNATMVVNLTGAMLCAAAAIRTMKTQQPQGGRIINNGSISAHSPRPRSVAYTVSKHAISGLTKSIELDGRAFGISAGQIDIGNTATDIMATLDVATGALQANGTLMVEPMFPVQEAARTVLFMASLPASTNIGHLVVTAAGMPFIGRG
ncbi:SDR family oxidoreductase [Arthrobacter antibioticus]|uniref:SDR family oxidoreductase n=1 Tax=Arthrobacter sp. H35-MC1 TaxID=3046203 RepID=UPI0024B9ABDD|nr:SDR family oxidoreductase [Arthrobacter sp. H35-MC1]MDJ0318895.1 SDR family oxidoreductase [Arthrobacter sp. H35-MC1]